MLYSPSSPTRPAPGASFHDARLTERIVERRLRTSSPHLAIPRAWGPFEQEAGSVCKESPSAHPMGPIPKGACARAPPARVPPSRCGLPQAQRSHRQAACRPLRRTLVGSTRALRRCSGVDRGVTQQREPSVRRHKRDKLGHTLELANGGRASRRGSSPLRPPLLKDAKVTAMRKALFRRHDGARHPRSPITRRLAPRGDRRR
jgi:hypothetical protein